MKWLLALLLLPVCSVAQSKRDYVAAMNKYVRLYNSGDDQKMCDSLFASDPGGCFWAIVARSGVHEGYGKILNHNYLGVTQKDLEHVTVFRVQYEKAGWITMSFTLRENNMFGTFRLQTSSAEISEMLEKAGK